MEALRIVARESSPLVAYKRSQVASGIALPCGWYYQCHVNNATLVAMPNCPNIQTVYYSLSPEPPCSRYQLALGETHFKLWQPPQLRWDNGCLVASEGPTPYEALLVIALIPGGAQ